MKAEYLPTFLKDVKRLRGSDAFNRIKAFAFDEIEAVTDLRSIPGIKRLNAPEEAYRVRIGDYRVGFYVRGGVVVFARALNRRDIYRHFP